MGSRGFSAVGFPDSLPSGWQMVFEKLMSIDDRDLRPAIDYVNDRPQDWDDSFRYGLEGLQAFREHYDPFMSLMSPDERARIEAYDEEWSLELLDHLHKKHVGGVEAPTLDYEVS